jgi:hypothetical protein
MKQVASTSGEEKLMGNASLLHRRLAWTLLASQLGSTFEQKRAQLSAFQLPTADYGGTQKRTQKSTF